LIGTTIFLVAIRLILGAWDTNREPLATLGWLWGSFSVLGGGGVAIWQFVRARARVEAEPTASLGNYLDVPIYREELGFVHHVEADLRRVLECVPQKFRPIVVFVDDLDRCSPRQVAQVVEAVNLFLAGEFPDCIFVLGMDPEMVAASLQAVYKEMVIYLPADAGIPVGWRFMDKFVQLPFHIPPIDRETASYYTTSLLSMERQVTAGPVAIQSQSVATVNGDEEPEVPLPLSRPEPETVRHRLDAGIREFDEENPELRRLIASAAVVFRGNPRELKRFINAFRFQYFLWWARQAQELEAPSLEQLVRWTVLSMKWPAVVRWLGRGSERGAPSEKDGVAFDVSVPSAPTRLKRMEDIACNNDDFRAWQTQVEAIFVGVARDTTAWLGDFTLFHFFREECTQHSPEERLSAGSGKGFW
jgi:hypothetical protein